MPRRPRLEDILNDPATQIDRGRVLFNEGARTRRMGVDQLLLEQGQEGALQDMLLEDQRREFLQQHGQELRDLELRQQRSRTREAERFQRHGRRMTSTEILNLARRNAANEQDERTAELLDEVFKASGNIKDPRVKKFFNRELDRFLPDIRKGRQISVAEILRSARQASELEGLDFKQKRAFMREKKAVDREREQQKSLFRSQKEAFQNRAVNLVSSALLKASKEGALPEGSPGFLGENAEEQLKADIGFSIEQLNAEGLEFTNEQLEAYLAQWMSDNSEILNQ